MTEQELRSITIGTQVQRTETTFTGTIRPTDILTCNRIESSKYYFRAETPTGGIIAPHWSCSRANLLEHYKLLNATESDAFLSSLF